MVGAYGNQRIEVREKAVAKSNPAFCYTPAGTRGAAPNLLSLDRPTHKQVLAFLEPNLVVGARLFCRLFCRQPHGSLTTHYHAQHMTQNTAPRTFPTSLIHSVATSVEFTSLTQWDIGLLEWIQKKRKNLCSNKKDLLALSVLHLDGCSLKGVCAFVFTCTLFEGGGAV